jgi:hypothetical protein
MLPATLPGRVSQNFTFEANSVAPPVEVRPDFFTFEANPLATLAGPVGVWMSSHFGAGRMKRSTSRVIASRGDAAVLFGGPGHGLKWLRVEESSDESGHAGSPVCSAAGAFRPGRAWRGVGSRGE